MFTKNLIPVELAVAWRVIALCANRDECQVDDFLSGLPANQAKHGVAMRRLLSTVAAIGPFYLPSEICHKIDDDLWQFRKGDIRVVWFHDGSKLIVCATAFIKKTKKTPANIIDNARVCMREYKLQKARGNIQET